MKLKWLVSGFALFALLNLALAGSVAADKAYLRESAHRIVPPDRPPRDIVIALTEYVRESVPNRRLVGVMSMSFWNRMNYLYNPFRVGPRTIFDHGKHHLGPCQSAGRLLIALLEGHDFPSRAVILHSPDMIGIHSVVEVDYEGKQGIVSPSYGMVYQHEDGTPATLRELKYDSELFMANVQRGFAYGWGPDAKKTRRSIPTDLYNFDHAYYFNYRWLGPLRQPVIAVMRTVFGEDSLYWLPYPSWYLYPATAALVILDSLVVLCVGGYWIHRRFTGRTRRADHQQSEPSPSLRPSPS